MNCNYCNKEFTPNKEIYYSSEGYCSRDCLRKGQFKEIHDLEADWDGEGGEKPNSKTLSNIEKLFDDFEKEGFELPIICPISDGSLQLDWDKVGRGLEIWFDEPDHILVLEIIRGEKTEFYQSSEKYSGIESIREFLEWYKK